MGLRLFSPRDNSTFQQRKITYINQMVMPEDDWEPYEYQDEDDPDGMVDDGEDE